VTYKLFYDDPYIAEAVCEMNEVIEKDDKILVVLNKSPFYPEGGGQLSDTGYMDGIKVSYVFEENDIIYHEVESRPEGKDVECRVDIARRKDHMMQHSGEHLLATAFFNLYKVNHSGFHMGGEYSTIDMNLKEINEEMVKRVEEEVNEYIYRNEPISTYFLSKEEAEKLPTRKEIKVEGNVRIVQIEGIDYSACCGTHVTRTGEIGLIKIVKTEKYKGMTRVYFKCGKRALKDYMNKHNIVNGLSRMFSVDENSVRDKIEAQADQLKDLNQKIKDLKKTLAAFDAEHLIMNAEEDILVKLYEDKSFDDIQFIAEQVEGVPHIFILGSLVDNRLMVFHDGSFNMSCGKLFKANLSAYNGKGGGSDKKAQAGFQSTEDMNNFIEKMKDEVESALGQQGN
jgi:alanyl-tRNA synthetase